MLVNIRRTSMQGLIWSNGDGVSVFCVWCGWFIFCINSTPHLKSKITLEQGTSWFLVFFFWFNWFQIDLVDSTFIYRVVNLRRIDMYPCLNAWYYGNHKVLRSHCMVLVSWITIQMNKWVFLKEFCLVCFVFFLFRIVILRGGVFVLQIFIVNDRR